MNESAANWQPSASIQHLKLRARLLAHVRQFFAEREVYEVETPALSHATVTDVHLSTFSTQFVNPLAVGSTELYLQTSPEYAMKRLLCAGSGSIYQIGKAFRNEEAGRFHNPEFTMLEWYRVGFDHHDLMDEVDSLVRHILGCDPAERVSYQQVFQTYVGVDPLSVELQSIQTVATQLGYGDIAVREQDIDTLLQLLFVEKVEPNIGKQRPCLVHSFPASQSALARINPTDTRVADRFELYFKGIELANGFYELADSEEQAGRFAADNIQRAEKGLPQKPIDKHLIAALEAGLPDCAGVALGLDRLFMLALRVDSVSQTMAFPITHA